MTPTLIQNKTDGNSDASCFRATVIDAALRCPSMWQQYVLIARALVKPHSLCFFRQLLVFGGEHLLNISSWQTKVQYSLLLTCKN